MGAGGDGFVAQDVAYVLDLQKFPEGALARIEHCEIMSRPSCFAGTSKLARNFLARLEELDSICPDARIVTFENVSGLRPSIDASGEGRCELSRAAPVPRDGRAGRTAFYDLRPLLDLQKQMAEDSLRPLIVTCLGAGGRIGMFAVTPMDVSMAERSVMQMWPMPQIDAHFIEVRGQPTPPPDQPMELCYMNRAYFGRENFCFEWSINGDNFLCTS